MLKPHEYQELVNDPGLMFKRDSGPLTYEISWSPGSLFVLEVDWTTPAALEIMSTSDMQGDYWFGPSDYIDAMWDWIEAGHVKFPGFGIIRITDENMMIAGSASGSFMVDSGRVLIVDSSDQVVNAVDGDGRGKNFQKVFLRWDRRSGRFKPVDAMASISYIEDYPHLSKLVKLAHFDPVAAINHIRSVPADPD